MKLKKMMRDYPIISCIVVAICAFVLSGVIGLLRKLLPESILIDYIRQIVSIIWPMALTILLGYGWCYSKGSFRKTLLAGLFALVLFSSTFLIRASETILNNETPWKPIAGICLGILSILGIGFREETIFRGIIANNLGIAYGKNLRGVWKAVIISGLIFGVAHLTNIIFGVNPAKALIQVISAISLGMYFTAVYYRGGNIWVLMLIHCLVDAGGLFRSAFTTEVTQADVVNNLSLNGLIMVPIYLVVTIFLLRKKKMNEVFDNLKQASEADNNLLN